MNLRDFIGVALILAFITSIPLLIYKSIPTENEQLIAYMLGQLSGFVAAVVAFHYVTKAGEKELDAQRAENTGKALDAIKAAAASSPPAGGGQAAADGADEAAEAAADRAEEIREAGRP